MEFVLIDRQNWKRSEYFEHYTSDVPCSFSLTAELDITLLVQNVKKRNLMFFPVFVHLLSQVINRHTEFRTCYNKNGELGYWREIWPCYTVFHNQSKSFSTLWTPFDADFDAFYLDYIRDWEKYGEIEAFSPKPDMPENVFNISCLPWVNFTAFNLQFPLEQKYLLPIFTLGKFVEKSEKIYAPLAVQMHHAVCDGYHAALLINELQDLCNDFERKGADR